MTKHCYVSHLAVQGSLLFILLPHSVMLAMNWSKSLQTKASPIHPLPVAQSKSPPSQGTDKEIGTG